MITAVLTMVISKWKQFKMKNILQTIIFIACIGLSRVVETITYDDGLLALDEL